MKGRNAFSPLVELLKSLVASKQEVAVYFGPTSRSVSLSFCERKGLEWWHMLNSNGR